MPKTSSKTCSNCRFFHPTTENEGACRRYPPITEGNSTRFPISLGEWDCGEHKPAPRKRKDA